VVSVRVPRVVVVLTGHLFAWLGRGQSIEPLAGRFVDGTPVSRMNWVKLSWLAYLAATSPRVVSLPWSTQRLVPGHTTPYMCPDSSLAMLATSS
jgi:hypothetical protein